MVGKNISHYKVLEELGRGGMGIVYRANDTKLDRTVAIKVLPTAAVASKDDRTRFYREAKAAAALNHPHIAQIYQIDEAVPEGRPDEERRPFIAMEFIEGGTLEDRVEQGPLKLTEAVRIATQIADALKAAHGKDIVHRDIKSANIMLTPDGQAKVLDFGLAQTAASTKLTRMGSTLGTVAYMSPEQARGEVVDGRTDLYSLGTVLYEMIAGRMPFAGEYEQAIVYSILNTDPEPLTALRTGVPMELENVVAKALRKDAKLRYQSAADLVADLVALKLDTDSASTHSVRSVKAMPAQSPTTTRPSFFTSAITGVVALLTGMLLYAVLVPSEPNRQMLDVALRLPGLDARIAREPAAAMDLLTLSPDGITVAYIGVVPEDGLYIKNLGSGEPARKIAARAATPAFSPDSRFIAFASEGTLFRAGLEGEAPERVVDGVADIVGLQWAEDGYMYFAADYATGLSRVWAEGGEMESLTVPDADEGEIGHVYPEMLPDGKNIVFNMYSVDGYELHMLNLDTGQIDNLGPGVSPHFIKPDILVFAQGPRLLAARLDIDEKRLGSPVVMSEAIYHNIAAFATNVGVSQDGDIVFIDGASTWGVPLEIRKWDGSREIVAPDVSEINSYNISSDGRFIVAQGSEAVADPDIWLYDLQTRDTRRLTTDPLWDAYPSFSGDGSKIWFSSERDGTSDIFSIDPATGDIVVVFRDEAPKFLSSASPDDRFLLFQRSRELWKLNLVGDARANVLVENPTDDRDTDISANGRWIAYTSDEFGEIDIFVMDDPLSRPRQRITIGGGQSPQWSLDGRYLYYKKGTELYRVAMNETGGRDGDPVRVMEGIYERFDLLPDGSGILVRAAPPRRTVRYIQDVVGRFEGRQDDL